MCMQRPILVSAVSDSGNLMMRAQAPPCPCYSSKNTTGVGGASSKSSLTQGSNPHLHTVDSLLVYYLRSLYIHTYRSACMYNVGEKKFKMHIITT